MPEQHPLQKSFPEHEKLEELVQKLDHHARIETVGHAKQGKLSFPLYSIVLGSKKPEAPVFGLFGGFHGLERIGSRVVLSYLETLSLLLEWDGMVHALLKRMRLVFMPLVNPIGMYRHRRSNGNGVDLMRNAPVDSKEATFLVGGHHISRHLPWYRGKRGGPMEIESQAVCDFVRREVFPSKMAITLDVHSGFGFVDRVWFPYAKSKKPFTFLAEMRRISNLLDRTYPNHFYQVEPQCHNYMTNGDVWDHIFLEHQKEHSGKVFIPLALEMGSWNWIRKNPLQLFSMLGPFNPVKPHRLQRTLRRHLIFFDFLTRIIASPDAWAKLSDSEKTKLDQEAKQAWYDTTTTPL